MKLTAVDDTNRLFLVEDLLPVDTVNQILNLELDTLLWRCPEYQAGWRRRELSLTPVLEDINSQISDSVLGTEFEFDFVSTKWWLDEPGFTVDIHTDGHLPSSMQIFWIAESTKYATAFYNSKNSKDVRYQFDFVANTGYMMLNGLDSTGAQPLQWHGMLNPTTKFRLTSYTTFGKIKSK